uniref:Protein kinase domain-containing protein n=1 Tax=Macrostomum lignano TaxID=282301 RepID=A0A1I8ICR1_9PLAT
SSARHGQQQQASQLVLEQIQQSAGGLPAFAVTSIFIIIAIILLHAIQLPIRNLFLVIKADLSDIVQVASVGLLIERRVTVHMGESGHQGGVVIVDLSQHAGSQRGRVALLNDLLMELQHREAVLILLQGVLGGVHLRHLHRLAGAFAKFNVAKIDRDSKAAIVAATGAAVQHVAGQFRLAVPIAESQTALLQLRLRIVRSLSTKTAPTKDSSTSAKIFESASNDRRADGAAGVSSMMNSVRPRSRHTWPWVYLLAMKVRQQQGELSHIRSETCAPEAFSAHLYRHLAPLIWRLFNNAHFFAQMLQLLSLLSANPWIKHDHVLFAKVGLQRAPVRIELLRMSHLVLNLLLLAQSTNCNLAHRRLHFASLRFGHAIDIQTGQSVDSAFGFQIVVLLLGPVTLADQLEPSSVLTDSLGFDNFAIMTTPSRLRPRRQRRWKRQLLQRLRRLLQRRFEPADAIEADRPERDAEEPQPYFDSNSAAFHFKLARGFKPIRGTGPESWWQVEDADGGGGGGGAAEAAAEAARGSSTEYRLLETQRVVAEVAVPVVVAAAAAAVAAARRPKRPKQPPKDRLSKAFHYKNRSQRHYSSPRAALATAAKNSAENPPSASAGSAGSRGSDTSQKLPEADAEIASRQIDKTRASTCASQEASDGAGSLSAASVTPARRTKSGQARPGKQAERSADFKSLAFGRLSGDPHSLDRRSDRMVGQPDGSSRVAPDFLADAGAVQIGWRAELGRCEQLRCHPGQDRSSSELSFNFKRFTATTSPSRRPRCTAVRVPSPMSSFSLNLYDPAATVQLKFVVSAELEKPEQVAEAVAALIYGSSQYKTWPRRMLWDQEEEEAEEAVALAMEDEAQLPGLRERNYPDALGPYGNRICFGACNASTQFELSYKLVKVNWLTGTCPESPKQRRQTRPSGYRSSQMQTCPQDPIKTCPQDPIKTCPQDPIKTCRKIHQDLSARSKTCPQDPIKTCPQDPIKTCPQDPIKTCPQDPIKTCPQDPIKTFPQDPFKTCPQDPIKTCPQDPIKTCRKIPSRLTCPQDPIKTCPQDPIKTCPQDPIKTCPQDPKTCPQDPFKTCPQDPFKTCPQDPIKTCPQDPIKTCPQDPIKTCPQDPIETYPQDPIKTCPQDPIKTCPQDPIETCPQDPIETYPQDPIKTCPQDPIETYPQDPIRTCPQDPTETYPQDPIKTSHWWTLPHRHQPDEYADGKLPQPWQPCRDSRTPAQNVPQAAQADTASQLQSTGANEDNSVYRAALAAPTAAQDKPKPSRRLGNWNSILFGWFLFMGGSGGQGQPISRSMGSSARLPFRWGRCRIASSDVSTARVEFDDISRAMPCLACSSARRMPRSHPTHLLPTHIVQMTAGQAVPAMPNQHNVPHLTASLALHSIPVPVPFGSADRHSGAAAAQVAMQRVRRSVNTGQRVDVDRSGRSQRNDSSCSLIDHRTGMEKASCATATPELRQRRQERRTEGRRATEGAATATLPPVMQKFGFGDRGGCCGCCKGGGGGGIGGGGSEGGVLSPSGEAAADAEADADAEPEAEELVRLIGIGGIIDPNYAIPTGCEQAVLYGVELQRVHAESIVLFNFIANHVADLDSLTAEGAAHATADAADAAHTDTGASAAHAEAHALSIRGALMCQRPRLDSNWLIRLLMLLLLLHNSTTSRRQSQPSNYRRLFNIAKLLHLASGSIRLIPVSASTRIIISFNCQRRSPLSNPALQLLLLLLRPATCSGEVTGGQDFGCGGFYRRNRGGRDATAPGGPLPADLGKEANAPLPQPHLGGTDATAAQQFESMRVPQRSAGSVTDWHREMPAQRRQTEQWIGQWPTQSSLASWKVLSISPRFVQRENQRDSLRKTRVLETHSVPAAFAIRLKRPATISQIASLINLTTGGLSNSARPREADASK